MIDNLFVQMGVRFISLAENVDSYRDPDSVSNIIVPITNVMNDNYCYQTSKKIRQVFDYKRRNGQYIGSFAPFGYIKDPKDKHRLLIDLDAAETVKQIYSMFLQGTSKRAIALYLNEHGVPSPSAYKKMKGLPVSTRGYVDPMWGGRMIHAILTNPTYTGDLAQGRSRVKSYKVHEIETVPRDEWVQVSGTHEAIIDHETFDKVQGLLLRDTRTSPKGREVHLFSGFLRCADCGNCIFFDRMLEDVLHAFFMVTIIWAKYFDNKELYGRFFNYLTSVLYADIVDNGTYNIYDCAYIKKEIDNWTATVNLAVSCQYFCMYFCMHHIDEHFAWGEAWDIYRYFINSGKITYAGSSNFGARHLYQAQWSAEKAGTLGLAVEQCQYSLRRRLPEIELLPAAKELGIGIMVWGPLDAGMLSGKVIGSGENVRTAGAKEKLSETEIKQLTEYAELCKEIGESEVTVSIAWLLHNPAVTTVVIGPRTVEQLESAARAVDLELSEEVLKRIDKIFPGYRKAPMAYGW